MKTIGKKLRTGALIVGLATSAACSKLSDSLGCYDPSRENPYSISSYDYGGDSRVMRDFPEEYKMNALTYEVFKRKTWPIVGYDWRTENHYDIDEFKDHPAVIELAAIADTNNDSLVTREEIVGVSKKQRKSLSKKYEDRANLRKLAVEVRNGDYGLLTEFISGTNIKEEMDEYSDNPQEGYLEFKKSRDFYKKLDPKKATLKEKSWITNTRKRLNSRELTPNSLLKEIKVDFEVSEDFKLTDKDLLYTHRAYIAPFEEFEEILKSLGYKSPN